MGEVAVSVERGMEMQVEEEEANNKECPFPRMFLRVLLIEADDSTRHIIAALLRKCCYKVAAVADGLKAWEMLKEKSHNIDLILTEVDLPSVSGFGLLTMIMEHEICKNIPVIMMSSQDSISTVFKGMMGGAADFLVKPIRKNELRNLWQHVWRRNSKNKECSEKGSDAQSSCMKPDMEAEPESTYVNDMQEPLQPKCRRTTLVIDTKEKTCQKNVKLGGASLMDENKDGGQSMKINPHVTPHNQTMDSIDITLEEKSANARAMLGDKDVALPSYKYDTNISDGHSNRLVEPSREAIDLIGALDNQSQCRYQHKVLIVVEGYVSKDNENISDVKDGKLSTSPLLELSLRRSQPDGCENQAIEDKHTLNHSKVSAFSRYSSRTLQSPFQASSSFTERRKVTGISNRTLPDPGHVNASSPEWEGMPHYINQVDTNSRVVNPDPDRLVFPCSRFGFFPVPAPMRGVSLDGSSGGYPLVRPILSKQSGLSLWSTNSTSHQAAIHVRSSNQSNPGTHNSEQNHFTRDQSGDKPLLQDVYKHKSEESKEDLKHISSTTGQSISTSLCNDNTSQFNSSGCGSACNGNNGNVTAAAVAGVTAESGNDEGILAGDRIRAIEHQCSSHREAALNKFRLKRKHRCYEKKVRYQSRKKLAEQRPRVKGQFVRQVQC